MVIGEQELFKADKKKNTVNSYLNARNEYQNKIKLQETFEDFKLEISLLFFRFL